MGSEARPSCEDLIEAVARRRDRQAFATLVEDYGPRIKRHLLGRRVGEEEAEELVQEILLAVWSRAETFDRSRAAGVTWLFTIARNKWIDGIRRQRRPDVDLADPATIQPAEDSPEEKVDRERRGALLRQELSELPPEQSEVLQRAYFGSQSMREIAQDTSTPLGTVKSRARLALERLRSAFSGDGE